MVALRVGWGFRYCFAFSSKCTDGGWLFQWLVRWLTVRFCCRSVWIWFVARVDWPRVAVSMAAALTFLLHVHRLRCAVVARMEKWCGEVQRWCRLTVVDGSHKSKHGAGPGAWSLLHLRDGAEGWKWWSCGAGDWRREWRLPQLTWWRLLGFPREEARVEDDDAAWPDWFTCMCKD